MSAERLLGCTASATAALAIGASVELLRVCVQFGETPAHAVHALLARSGAVGVTEGIGPPFRQGSPESCGAAALAFALTRLGETTSEAALLRLCNLPHRSLSFADLARCSRQLGVPATGVKASWHWLVERGDRPSVLHMTDHFVTILRATPDEAMVFDPARGAVLRQSREMLSARWTENALALDLASPIGALRRP
jgi:hypothetical protein